MMFPISQIVEIDLPANQSIIDDVEKYTNVGGFFNDLNRSNDDQSYNFGQQTSKEDNKACFDAWRKFWVNSVGEQKILECYEPMIHAKENKINPPDDLESGTEADIKVKKINFILKNISLQWTLGSSETALRTFLAIKNQAILVAPGDLKHITVDFTNNSANEAIINTKTVFYALMYESNDGLKYRLHHKRNGIMAINPEDISNFQMEDCLPLCSINTTLNCKDPLKCKVSEITIEINDPDLKLQKQSYLSKNAKALLANLEKAYEERLQALGNQPNDPISNFMQKTITLLKNDDKDTDQCIREINNYLINYTPFLNPLFSKKDVKILKEVQEDLKKGNLWLYIQHAPEWHKKVLLKEIDPMIRDDIQKCLSEAHVDWNGFLKLEKYHREVLLKEVNEKKSKTPLPKAPKERTPSLPTQETNVNTLWSRFKQNWSAGSILAGAQKESTGADRFSNNLLIPLTIALLLPLQILLYPAIHKVEPEKWWKTIIRWGVSIPYTVAVSVAMALLAAPTEVLNVFVAAGLALFKKESLTLNFYGPHAQFGDENEYRNGSIYNFGITAGKFIWALPVRLYHFLTNKKTAPEPKTTQPRAEPEIVEEKPISREEQYLSNLPAYNKFKQENQAPLMFHQLKTGPAVSMKHDLKNKFSSTMPPSDQDLLRLSLMKECLLFLHAQAKLIEPSASPQIYTIQAVDMKGGNSPLLTLKEEALEAAVAAYNKVFDNSRVQFKVEERDLPAPREVAEENKLPEEAVAFCEALKEESDKKKSTKLA